MILDALNVEKYYIVDPYTSYDEYVSDGFNNVLEDEDDKIFESMNEKFKNYPVEFIRKFSDDGVSDIKNKVDLCFIDGNHEYEYVLNDIKNYFPKVKKGGIVCGDDYFMRNKNNDTEKANNCYDMDMVYEAVQKYFSTKKYTLEEFGMHGKYPKTWLVKK